MKASEEFAFSLPEDVKDNLDRTLSKITSFTEDDFLIEELSKPSTHLLKRSGKLLRPTLMFLGAQAIGEKGGKFVNLAAAVELLHVSSLIHDDILDKGTVRRGTKTVNIEYGEGAALLAGDALISKAISLSSEYGKNVVDAFSNTALMMAAGELLDHKSKQEKIDLERYISVAELKTATLAGLSSNVVAIYKKSEAKGALYRYGFNVGIAFQIRDDIVDYLDSNSDDSKDEGSCINIVKLVKENYGVGEEKALQKAKSLNHHYINEALAELRGNDMMRTLEAYTGMIKVK